MATRILKCRVIYVLTEMVDQDEFDRRKRDIETDIDRTLERVIDVWPKHWKGVIAEWLQNSGDGWYTNRFNLNAIPEDRELELELQITRRGDVYLIDNAGGMSGDVLEENFAGLDSPSDPKKSGGSGGAYGRGSHVMSGAAGDKMYAETLHNGERNAVAVDGSEFAPMTPKGYKQGESGTLIEIQDCISEVLNPLQDTDKVAEFIRTRFHSLLQQDDVTVVLDTPNERRELEPYDLSEFEVLYEADELEFERSRKTHKLKNLRIYNRRSSDKEVPFSGISALKRNELVDHPFMRVKEYNPHVRHSEKMFGFVDATMLCPEYEDNAHNDFKYNILSYSPLSDILEDLAKEHFYGKTEDFEELEKVKKEALNRFNRQWKDRSVFEDEDDPKTDDEVDRDGDEPEEEVEAENEDVTLETNKPGDDLFEKFTNQEDDDDPYVGRPDEKQERTPETQIICQSRSSLQPNEEGSLQATIKNPEDSEVDEEQFRVAAEVDCESLETLDRTVPNGEICTGISWGYEGTEAATHEVKATLKTSNGTVVDTDSTTFTVGSTKEEEEQDTVTHALMERIGFFKDEEKPWRFELHSGDEGGFELLVNSKHSEWQAAKAEDGAGGISHQVDQLIHYANEAIVGERFERKLRNEIEDITNDEGESLADELVGFYNTNVQDALSQYTHETYSHRAKSQE